MSQTFLSTTVFILTLLHFTTSQKIPCFPWRNSFVKIQPSPAAHLNESTVSLIVKSTQKNGWLSIGFSENSTSFENSIFILVYLPDKLFILKNHTQKEETNKIFNVDTTQTFGNKVDGIFTFSFQMNGSLLQDKKFLYFAQNEHSLTAPDNQSLSIPPHTTNSGPIFIDFMNPKAIYPLCLDKLNLPNRVLNNHWVFYVLGTLFCITLCLLFFILRNEQPLKSRFIGPVFGFLMYGLSLSADFWQMQYNFDVYTHYGCFIQIFITYPMIQMNIVLPTLILIRYSMILQLYLHKSDFIKKTKELQRTASTMVVNNTTNNSSFLTRMDSQWKSFQENSIKVQFDLRLRQILLFLQNPWSLVIVPMIWNVLFLAFLLTLFAVNKFYCEASTVLLAKNFHLAVLGIAAMMFALFFILDMLFSLRNFIRCRWKKYFLEEDPFHFQSE
jgi:hypothetical protein